MMEEHNLSNRYHRSRRIYYQYNILTCQDGGRTRHGPVEKRSSRLNGSIPLMVSNGTYSSYHPPMSVGW